MSAYFDMHCHLLYGVDDGPESIEESLGLLHLEYDDGVRTVFLTPHYRKGMFECPADQIARHFSLLKDRAKERFPDLTLILGCEIHVNVDVVQRIKNGQCFPMGDTEYVLLEFPEYVDRRYFIEKCYDVINDGYSPVIAHAERCTAIRSDISLLQRLVDMGVQIQMNAGSVIGEEGLRCKWFCRKAMEHNLLHYVGSDAHNRNCRKPNIGKCAAYIEKIMGADYRDKIMRINPKEMAEGSAEEENESEHEKRCRAGG